MYIVLLLLLVAMGVLTVVQGVRENRGGKTFLGGAILLATILFFGFLSFWGEKLWFDEVGYSARFWKIVGVKVAAAAAAGLLGWIVLRLLTLPARHGGTAGATLAAAVGSVVGAVWGLANWEAILMYLNREPAGIREPIFGMDAGFYLFALPLYSQVCALLLTLAGIGFAAALAFLLSRSAASLAGAWRALYVSAGFAALVLGLAQILALFRLMYSRWGVVFGPGWTDVHVRIPAYWVVAAGCMFVGLLFVIPPARRRLQQRSRASRVGAAHPEAAAIAAPAICLAALWLVALGLIPALVQWLRVQPNEISLEKPYLANNIEFTRLGFRLHDAGDRQFPASDTFNQATAEANRGLLAEVRLWDGRALDAVYKQFQEIRLYYEFTDVDIDRYRIGGRYRQVMVSAREMNPSNLPKQSQTFVNKRFKYTHGNGLTLAPVTDFTPEGLPNLLLKDIPPKAEFPELKIERPEIYYGELTHAPVVVNSLEPEFDYPKGDENVYVRYQGTGGVPLTGLWRKFLFGWKFDGTRFLLSSYPTRESRLMFHRAVAERVGTIAPFLTLDDDPYIVLVDGKLYWIVDAYTTSRHFPYSEPFNSREAIEYREGDRTRLLQSRAVPFLNRANYARNSVKVTVDAFDGSVRFYVFEPGDPIIRVWRKAFPGLFRSREEMPAGLVAHVRYPHNFLLAQGLVYAKYHMQDPEVFYNQEDIWIRATEKYYAAVQPVEPYYIMWKQPGSQGPEFSVILPFTPKKRQVLIGWLAGLCDGANYGRLLTYKFPKDTRLLGPQQVETKIDQDPYLSGQLTLWNQMGSRVIRGNVLAIPVDNTLLYVEPIYLQAETAAYPELRLVAVMHKDNLSYAPTFEEALRGLIAGGAPARATPASPVPSGVSLAESIRQANTAFENYLRMQGERRFAEAARELEKLERSLRDLMRNSERQSRRP